MAVRFTEHEALALANKYPHLKAVLFPTPVCAEPIVERVRSHGSDTTRKSATGEPQRRTNVLACIAATILWLAGIGFGVIFIAANIIAAPITFLPAVLIAAMVVCRGDDEERRRRASIDKPASADR